MNQNLIAITGLDGSGKSLQCKLLLKKIEGYKCVWARYNPILLRGIINLFNKINLNDKKVDNKTYSQYTLTKSKIFRNFIIRNCYLMLGFIDYFSQIFFKVYIPLFFGKKILLDRYYYDYIVDLIINFGLDDNEISRFCQKKLFKLFIKPRIAILLDISSEVSIKRKDDPNIPNKQYLEKRRQNYLLMAKEFNIKIIDASKSINEVQKNILELIK